MAQIRERGIYAFATPRDGRIALSWHSKNELKNYGYIDSSTSSNKKLFRISRWLNPDGGPSIYDDVEPIRYSELSETGTGQWEARMRPWGDSQEAGLKVGFFGYNKKEATDYVDRRLYTIYESGKFDSIHVAYKPFGGEPMICGVKDGKVTIL